MGDMADWVIENGMLSELDGEFDDDGCEFCGEPGKLRIIDGTPNNCGITQRVMCDECWAEELAG